VSVDQTNVVDFIGIDDATGSVVLTIADHLAWSEGDNEHLLLLQEKLNTYLGFVESGELLKTYPSAEGRAVLIDVVCKYPLSQQAQGFCNQAAQITETAGIKLRARLSE
jgi:DNA-binding beta-propeller fold protein YncE